VPVNPLITGKTLHVDGGALWARPGTSETNESSRSKEESTHHEQRQHHRQGEHGRRHRRHHPYKSDFLDTWTLLSWVAARTERIGVSGNVLNLPLRQPPAVLARAASSLDLLSGGRMNLAIGAGAYWDAVESVGGRRLTPRQGVDALGEAIDVIRGIWDAAEPGALQAGGEFYKVDGAERGPAPAHDIPIWLGAYKPRMLDLVGRKADGWLPSLLPFMKPDGVQRGNVIIDDAARAAGRDPREITRLLNIFPDQTPEALTQMAVEDGVSIFILVSDDPEVFERLAAEVIPAVHEQVARERKSA
jgi:alkanesulfonate monooxygenase SsuD/methylene tetrahydromethanopterin reductase-like flavin-dependent oxidoreductase (luciferase family)